MTATQLKIQIWFFTIFLIGMAILAFFVFQPYLSAVILAAAFAVVFYPLYLKIRKLLFGRENIAALITTVSVLVVVVIPLTFFSFQIFKEAQVLYLYIVSPDNDIANIINGAFQEQINDMVPGFSVDFTTYAERSLQWLLQHIGPVFSGAAKLIVSIFLGLLAFFYLVRDGEKLKKAVLKISPLNDLYDRQIITRLQLAVNSVIRGSLVIALIQGVLTGVGLTIFGVPNAALWGSVTVLAALIPSIGTATIIAPAIAYLFLTNHVYAAGGLLIWGVLAVGLIDNLLGPKLISHGVKLHPMVILFSVIGGLQFFGPIGYILGPLVISLLFVLLDIYPSIINPPNGK